MKINDKIIKILGISATVLALTATSAFARPAEATAPVNVRTGPGLGFHVVDRLHRGENVNISRRSHGWCYVQKTGRNGWVSCAYLTADNYGNWRYRDRPNYRSYDYNVGPGVTFQFGFGGNGYNGRNGNWNNSHNGHNNGNWQHN